MIIIQVAVAQHVWLVAVHVDGGMPLGAFWTKQS
jgi:hypothetical protein